jgi:dethiobiotin synthetase
MGGVFVTGTDTGCGKTTVATALLRGLASRGLRAAGYKPVASGAERCDGFLRNDDALTLWRAGIPGLHYDEINPYCFAPAIAPHIAADEAGVAIDLAQLVAGYRALGARADWVIVEGAGGWRVPLAEGLDMQGLAIALGIPVVMVVGLRLGCINHALLTAQAIRAAGVPLLGWIGSAVDPAMARRDVNVAFLQDALDCPALGLLPSPDDSAAADSLAAQLLAAWAVLDARA